MTDVLTRFGVTYAEVESLQTLTQGTGDSLSNDVVLTGEAQYLILEVTLEQYTKLLSAALNGANRYFPDEYISIIYPLIKAAKMDASLCAAIAECIADSDSGTYSALEEWLLDQLLNNQDVTSLINGSGGTLEEVSSLNTAVLGADCDPDYLFGFTKQLTQMMDTVVTDVYQKLEEKTNFLEALPIISQEVNAFAYFVEWIEFLLNSVRDAYLGNYDLTYENEIACGLFCLALENEDCSLTWQEVTDFFAERIDATSVLETLADLLVFLVAGSWSGTQFCDLSLLAFASVMRFGAEWTGIDLSALQRIVAAFWNDPDGDWSTLCDCGWTFTEDFVSSTGVFSWTVYPAGWTPTTRGTLGTVEDLIDTQNVYTPLDRRFEGVSIEVSLATPVNIKGLMLDYNAGIDGNANSKIQLYNGVTSVYLYEWQLSNTGGTPVTVDIDTDVTADKIVIALVSGFKVGSNPGSSLNLPFVTIQGLGTKPPEFS
jgi:hypothetical protein